MLKEKLDEFSGEYSGQAKSNVAVGCCKQIN